MRVGVANTKGGVGKTTTAIYLAAAGLSRGLTVEVQDMDKQGSATSWVDGIGHVEGLSVTVANAYTVKRPTKADLTVIDTSPADPRDIETVAAACDFVVVPTTPGSINDDRTRETVAFLEGKGVAFGVLLVAAQPHTIATRTSRDALVESAPVFETEIPARQEITRAFGTLPSGDALFGYDALLREIEGEVL